MKNSVDLKLNIALNIAKAEKALMDIRDLLDQYYAGLLCGYELMDSLVEQKGRVIMEIQQIQSKLMAADQ